MGKITKRYYAVRNFGEKTMQSDKIESLRKAVLKFLAAEKAEKGYNLTMSFCVYDTSLFGERKNTPIEFIKAEEDAEFETGESLPSFADGDRVRIIGTQDYGMVQSLNLETRTADLIMEGEEDACPMNISIYEIIGEPEKEESMEQIHGELKADGLMSQEVIDRNYASAVSQGKACEKCLRAKGFDVITLDGGNTFFPAPFGSHSLLSKGGMRVSSRHFNGREWDDSDNESKEQETERKKDSHFLKSEKVVTGEVKAAKRPKYDAGCINDSLNAAARYAKGHGVVAFVFPVYNGYALDYRKRFPSSVDFFSVTVATGADGTDRVTVRLFESLLTQKVRDARASPLRNSS